MPAGTVAILCKIGYHKISIQAAHQLVGQRAQSESLADCLGIDGRHVVLLGEAVVRHRSTLHQHLEQTVGTVRVIAVRNVDPSGMPLV